MIGVRTDQSGAVAGDFVGDPAAASHTGVKLKTSINHEGARRKAIEMQQAGGKEFPVEKNSIRRCL
jgi:hypothetical protein